MEEQDFNLQEEEHEESVWKELILNYILQENYIENKEKEDNFLYFLYTKFIFIYIVNNFSAFYFQFFKF